MFVVKARLKKTVRQPYTTEKHLQWQYPAPHKNVLSHAWFGETKPTMEKEKQRAFLSFVLFLKALGYFLLPSFFFPDQEFTTPHGFF